MNSEPKISISASSKLKLNGGWIASRKLHPGNYSIALCSIHSALGVDYVDSADDPAIFAGAWWRKLESGNGFRY